MHTHNVLRHVTDAAKRMAVRPRDVILMYLPLFHAFGLYEGPLISLVTGARRVLMEHCDPGEALRLMASERITMIHGFDTHFQDLMEHPTCAQTDRSSLRSGLLAAGLASTEPVARRAQRELCPTVSGWGMTEVGVGAARDFPTDMVIDPATGHSVPYGTPGELCCRGYGVMQG
jgi:fatty-acyl-CoA synthase